MSRAPCWPGMLLGLLLAGCAGSQRAGELPSGAGQAATSADVQPADAAGKVLDFELDTADGGRVRLGELLGRGRLVLLSFWATWCEPCKLELPHLVALQQQYGEQGLTVLAVSVDEPAAQAELRSFLRSRHISLIVPLDMDRRVTDLYNPKMIMPFLVLLDRRGHPVRAHQGYLPGDEELLEREVRGLLSTRQGGSAPTVR